MESFFSNNPKTQQNEELVTPPPEDFQGNTFNGSLQQILTDNIGQYVVVEFLIGTQNMTTREGILYFVGVSYIVLYDEQNNQYTICDLFSIKFVTFFEPGRRPRSSSRR